MMYNAYKAIKNVIISTLEVISFGFVVIILINKAVDGITYSLRFFNIRTDMTFFEYLKNITFASIYVSLILLIFGYTSIFLIKRIIRRIKQLYI